jgi:probable rRNA maturation factor
VNSQGLRRFLTELLHLVGIGSCSLSFSLVTKKVIQKLNKTYRGKDSSTDVLSFPMFEWKKPFDPRKHKNYRSCLKDSSPMDMDASQPLPLGDIVLCPDVAKVNAVHIGQTLDEEVRFLIVHSLLHLVGHDHMIAKEEKLMLSLQRYLIAELKSLKLGIRPLVREVRS